MKILGPGLSQICAFHTTLCPVLVYQEPYVRVMIEANYSMLAADCNELQTVQTGTHGHAKETEGALILIKCT